MDDFQKLLALPFSVALLFSLLALLFSAPTRLHHEHAEDLSFTTVHYYFFHLPFHLFSLPHLPISHILASLAPSLAHSTITFVVSRLCFHLGIALLSLHLSLFLLLLHPRFLRLAPLPNILAILAFVAS